MHMVSSQQDDRCDSIPIDGPIQSTVTIGGRLYLLQTWTQAQWERMAPEARPKGCWRHGLQVVRIVPS